MTIDRQYGKIIFACDIGTVSWCDGYIETGEREFEAAFTVAKAEGWRAIPLDSADGAPKFIHVCGNCPTPR